MITVSGIRKRYGTLDVLKGVDLSVAKGEVVSIVGASGAGKTTLLQILGTLERADAGSLLINGEEITRMGSKALSAFRNKHIGFVFQFHQLLPEFSAMENVMMPGLIGGRGLKACEPRAMELLERLNIGGRAGHKPSQLSGGEQQRVAVARALIMQPALLLADEPTGNLDTQSADAVFDLFRQVNREHRTAVLLVTHNPALAKRCDRIIQVVDGRAQGD